MNDKIEIGTIIDIRQIEIKQNNYLPTIGGAVIGGLLGSKKKIGELLADKSTSFLIQRI